VAVVTSREARIPLEELCRLPSFFFPQVSWKGDKVGFYWDKSGRIELYVMDLATKAIRQVSHGEVPRAMRTGFAWSRDDRFIAFGKDAGGNEQHDLYKIEVETGEVTQLSKDPAAEEHAIQFSPDDRWLTVGTNKRLPESPDRPGQLNLWKIRADGSEYVPLTRYAFPVFGGLWSDDGEWISYVTNEDLANLKNRDGYVVRRDGTGAKKIFSVRPGSQDTLGDWHPDSRRIAATSDASGQNRAGIVDAQTGAVRWYSPERIEEHALRFSKNGKWLVTIRNEESQVRPILYDVDSGKARDLKLPAGFALGAQFFANDTKLLINCSTDVTRSALVERRSRRSCTVRVTSRPVRSCRPSFTSTAARPASGSAGSTHSRSSWSTAASSCSSRTSEARPATASIFGTPPSRTGAARTWRMSPPAPNTWPPCPTSTATGSSCSAEATAGS